MMRLPARIGSAIALTVATLLLLPLGLDQVPGLPGIQYAHAIRSVPKEKRKIPLPEKKPEQAKEPAPKEAPAEAPSDAIVPPITAPAAATANTPAAPPLPPEGVEADVSARSIAVTSGFAGTEIIVFGSVDNSRQPSAEAGYYDVVVVVEGTPEPIVARRKSNVAGLWMNTASLGFDRVPSYYAIASTRPVEEIAEAQILGEHGIGFQHVKLRPRVAPVPNISEAEVAAFQSAVIRLKQKERLYLREDYDVTFIGRSLFRASVELPANIPVGPLDTRVYLFRDGKLLGHYASRIILEREGAERWLHSFALNQAFFYGLFVVAIALSAGIAASAVFRRPG